MSVLSKHRANFYVFKIQVVTIMKEGDFPPGGNKGRETPQTKTPPYSGVFLNGAVD
jgi:hypothetical protein